MTNLTQEWQQFVATRRDDFVGGDIQQNDISTGNIHGPITDIRIEDNQLVITTGWTAFAYAINRWRKVDGNNAFRYRLGESGAVDDIVTLPQEVDGMIRFDTGRARVYLIPRGGAKLDPSRVEGL